MFPSVKLNISFLLFVRLLILRLLFSFQIRLEELMLDVKLIKKFFLTIRHVFSNFIKMMESYVTLSPKIPGSLYETMHFIIILGNVKICCWFNTFSNYTCLIIIIHKVFVINKFFFTVCNYNKKLFVVSILIC